MKHVVTELVLPNGVKGLLVHIPDATVLTCEINFRAGEYLLERDKWETAHLLEHLIFNANERFSRAKDFQREIEKNGAYYNASTGAYDITYEVECADFEWQRVMELFIFAITKPLFLEEEFQAEFGNVKEELTARSNNHFRHLGLALREKYGLCAMTDQERAEKMKNVTLADVKAHYEATHTTDNIRFVVAGKLPAVRQASIQKMFESLALPTKNGRPKLPLEKPKKLSSPLLIPNKTVDNVYFYIDTFMSRWMENNETDAVALANNMLTETLHSRIFGAAREQGLVYGMSSSYARWNGGSNWWFAAQVMPQNMVKLFDIIVREIGFMKSGKINDQDIIAAKQYALGRYQRSAQTVAGTASGYSSRFFFDDQIEDYYEIPQRIDNVTKEEMVAVAQALFSEGIGGLGVLGNTNKKFVHEILPHIQPLWQKD
jgi:predicted Zn-dependent peptidase